MFVANRNKVTLSFVQEMYVCYSSITLKPTWESD